MYTVSFTYPLLQPVEPRTMIAHRNRFWALIRQEASVLGL